MLEKIILVCSYTIGYNWNIYKILCQTIMWIIRIITWISKYYYVILYNKQHTLSYKSMKLLPLSCRGHSSKLLAAGVRTLFQASGTNVTLLGSLNRGMCCIKVSLNETPTGVGFLVFWFLLLLSSGESTQLCCYNHPINSSIVIIIAIFGMIDNCQQGCLRR